MVSQHALPVAQSKETVSGVSMKLVSGKKGSLDTSMRDVLRNLRVPPVEVSYEFPHALDIFEWSPLVLLNAIPFPKIQDIWVSLWRSSCPGWQIERYMRNYYCRGGMELGLMSAWVQVQAEGCVSMEWFKWVWQGLCVCNGRCDDNSELGWSWSANVMRVLWDVTVFLP